MFKRPQRAVGLDVGSNVVKAVQLTRSGDGLVIERAAKTEVDQEQYAVDPLLALSSAVNDSASRCELARSVVVVSLPGHSIVTRYLKLQEMPKEELAGAIEIEAGQSIPYDLSEVMMNHQKLVMLSDKIYMKVWKQ